MQKGTLSTTSLLTCLHLLVDGLCACCVFMLAPRIGAENSLLLFVLYNALAFLTQPLFGQYVDSVAKRSKVFGISMALLTLGGCLAAASIPYAAITSVGLGNALFHVYGGKTVAVQTGNDMRHLGIFVSSGAIGLVVGEQYASLGGLAVIALVMLSLAALLFQQETATEAVIPCMRQLGRLSVTPRPASAVAGMPYLLLFILLIVFIRAFIGKLAPHAVQSSSLILFGTLTSILAFAGKSLGGFIARKFGAWNTLTVTLLLTGACLLLSPQHLSFALALVLVINLTMPITLWLANQSLPGREGLSFGLLAAMLPLGVGLGATLTGYAIATPLLYVLVATMLIEVLVLLALREYRWQVLAMSVVMNILTNLPLNILVYNYPQIHASLPMQIGLECGVVAIETMLYWMVLKDKRKAFSYAILCNATSYLLGMLYSMIC